MNLTTTLNAANPHGTRPGLTRIDRAIAGARTLFRALALASVPFFLLHTIAFVSFIYEEAIQAASLACKTALDAADPGVTRDAIYRLERLTRRAQTYQRRWGKLAFWLNDAYDEYFHVAAPTQIAAYASAGTKAGLWHPDDRRWKLVKESGHYTWVDTWDINPIERLAIEGFDVTMLTPVERYKLAGIEALYQEPDDAAINNPHDYETEVD